MYHLAEEIQPRDELGFGHLIGEYEMSEEEMRLYDQSEHESDLRNKLLESAKILDHAIDEYISPYSAPECQALCKRMQQTLPRELRDNVLEVSGECETMHMGETLTKYSTY